MIEYEVGDGLWLHSRHDRCGRYVTVEKVGRRWAWLSGGLRVRLDSVDVDGGDRASPGRLYSSKAEYEAMVELHRKLGLLRSSIPYRVDQPTDELIEWIETGIRLFGTT